MDFSFTFREQPLYLFWNLELWQYTTQLWKYSIYTNNNSSEQINNKYRHHDRHSLRKNTNNFIRVPEIQLRRKCTGFTYCGAKIFNNLPNNIRETQDSIIFKNLVKNWIWDEVPSNWLHQNIYLTTYIYIFTPNFIII